MNPWSLTHCSSILVRLPFHSPVMFQYMCVSSVHDFLFRLGCVIRQRSDWLPVRADCHAWWRHQMETFSMLLALCEGKPPVTGGFSSQRPVTRNFGVLFDPRLNKQLSKQSGHRWFETPSHSLWRHCNGVEIGGIDWLLRDWMIDWSIDRSIDYWLGDV